MVGGHDLPSSAAEPGAATAPYSVCLVAYMASYLDQLGVSARPSTVGAAEQALRHFAGQVTEADPTCISMGGVERRHIETHKLWLVGTLRTFFERLRDWDYDDAPSHNKPLVPLAEK